MLELEDMVEAANQLYEPCYLKAFMLVKFCR